MMRPPPTSVWVMKAVAAAAKTSSQPAIAPGKRQRQDDGEEDAKAAGAQVPRRPSPGCRSSRSRLLMTGKRHQRKLDLRQRNDQPVPV